MAKENFFVNKFIFFHEKNINDYFHNALVYIFEHNKNGALGVVVNKIIPISEEKIFKSLNIENLNHKKHILNGGPVDINKLFVIHDLPNEKESLCVENGLSLTSSIDVLKNIAKGEFTNKYRLALGYCGWDAGQLDYEVLKNSWLILDNKPNIVFENDPKDLVKEISRQVGYDIDKVQNSEIITKH